MNLIHNQYSLDSVENGTSDKHRITITEYPCLLDRLFGCKERHLQLEGSGTVWYFHPSGRRAGTGWEHMITNMMKRREMMKAEAEKDSNHQ